MDIRHDWLIQKENIISKKLFLEKMEKEKTEKSTKISKSK